jgi:hypothetical protein
MSSAVVSSKLTWRRRSKWNNGVDLDLASARFAQSTGAKIHVPNVVELVPELPSVRYPKLQK